MEAALRLLLCAIAVVGPVSVLALLIWARDRGFDFTDEGMYLLSAQHPEEIHVSATLAYVYLAPLLRLVDGDVAAFRVLGYGLVVFAASVLWFGVRRAVGNRDSDLLGSFGGFAVVLAGALLYYVWFLPTPSYDLLNAVSVSMFGGALLSGLGWSVAGRAWLAASAWLVAGVVIGFDAFVKLPTAASLAMLALLAVLFWPALSPRSRLSALIVGLCGSLLWFALHFVVLQPPAAAWRIFHAGADFARVLDPRYTVLSALSRAFEDSWQLAKDAVSRYAIIYIVTAIFGAIVAFSPITPEKRERWLNRTLAVAVAAAIIVAVKKYWYIAGVAYIQKITPLAGGALLLAAAWRLWQEWQFPKASSSASVGGNRAELLIVLLLTALPFADAVGTNNPLTINMAMSLGPWLAAVWLLTSRASHDGVRTWGGWVLPAFLAALCSAQVLYGCLNDPYRLNGGLLRQTIPVQIGSAGSRLYVDAEDAAFIEGLHQASVSCSLRPGSPVLAFYDLPGVVYALGAVSPGIPWFVGGYPGTTQALESVLAKVPLATLRQAAIAVAEPLPPSALPDLALLGIDFPNGYRNCAVLAMPGRLHGHSLSIWAPPL